MSSRETKVSSVTSKPPVASFASIAGRGASVPASSSSLSGTASRDTRVVAADKPEEGTLSVARETVSGSSDASSSKLTEDDYKSGLVAPPVDARVRTEDVTKTAGHRFEEYGLKRELLMGIFELGWSSPSPIQEASIPAALNGKDVLGRAKNGTGKTGSYAIPVVQKIDPSLDKVQAIVLVPTRELALQTSSVIKSLGKHTGLECMVCIGGTPVADDVLRLKSPVHVIVATTGRLLDLAEHRSVDLRSVSMVVLDEADKMLSDWSCEHVEKLIGFCPARTQFLLFSATFPDSVSKFSRRYLRDPLMVNLMEELTLKGITQYYAFVTEADKVRCLRTIFSRLEISQAIIFCSSAERVELLARTIADMKLTCLFIHSKMPQEERNKVYQEFSENRSRNLVSTDLFTRGIDIATVNVVINFDFPSSSETYLHRIGRSGRFGHLGVAISFVTERNTSDLFRVEMELSTEIKPIPKIIRKEEYCI